MKRYLAHLSLVLAICLLFCACGGAGQTENNTTEYKNESSNVTDVFTENNEDYVTENRESEEKATEIPSTEEASVEKTVEESMTEATTTEEITTEAVTTEADTTGDVLVEVPDDMLYAPELESATPEMIGEDFAFNYFVSGDGMQLWQHSYRDEAYFWSACAYLEDDGYGMYSLNREGDAISAVYTKGDAYYTLLYSNISTTLYIGRADTGALSFPEQSVSYIKVCETTVTQGYSANINGMTYIFRLADNSFIIVDGGYEEDAKNLIKTLQSLSGLESEIHVRAWLLSHSHGDHYPAFSTVAQKYSDIIVLDTLMYSPAPEEKVDNKYFNGEVLEDVARFEGAVAVSVHAGMLFRMADVELEVLATNEYIFKDYESLDLNETSTVFRIKNADGSIMLLGDCYGKVSRFLVDTYGGALKSDMMQVSHHGVEQATIELYEIIAPSLAFWPCSESLLCNQRGTTTKQYLLQNENIHEHIIHGYGNATRPLSYKAERSEGCEVLNDGISVRGSNYVDNIRFEDGVLKYDVIESDGGMDPYVYFKLEKGALSTEKYNAVRIVARAGNYSDSYFFFTCGSDGATRFSTKRRKQLGPQGVGEDGLHTMIIYLGNTEDYTGSINGVRLDIGTEAGQTVEIYSIEFFYVDID